MRSQVSLLLDHNHPNAHWYPIRLVWEEVRIIEARENQKLAMNAQLFQMALSTQPNMPIKDGTNKKAVQAFTEVVDLLRKG